MAKGQPRPTVQRSHGRFISVRTSTGDTHMLQAFVDLFLEPRLPPGTIDLPERPNINRAALVLAAILLFLARAAQFQQQNNLVDAFVVTALFASSATAVAFVRRKLLGWASTRKQPNQLTRFLVATLDNRI